MTNPMTRQQVAKIALAAHAKNERPNLSYANLAGLNLAELNLYRADLTGADLRDANLRGALLADTDLSYTTLQGANLHGANLHGTHLRSTTLTGANLDCVNLAGVNLDGAYLTGLKLDGLPSGALVFIPTPSGWYITIGGWDGTTDELREMISGGDDWPDARGAEIAARRPMLEAAADMCDAYAAAHPDAVAKAKAAAGRWNV